MATTIKLKNSVTTTNTPSSLAQGEVAINITDKKVWVGNAATTPIQIAGAGTTGNAAGSNTQVQYNSSGSFAGDADFTFNGTTVTMANDATISGLTVGKGGGAVSTNTVVGYQAQNTSTSGTANTEIGYQAGYAGTSAGANTLVGYRTGYALTSGGDSTFIGYQAGLSATTSADNTALGSSALRDTTTGASNVAVGRLALAQNTTASNNTAVGYQAGYANTTGTENAAFGKSALAANTTANNNSAFGCQALLSNTTGASNTAAGQNSLISNTTGAENAAFGKSAMNNNSTASNNSAFGCQSMYNNTTGTNNVSIGHNTMIDNTTGSYNTAVGETALKSNTTASNNTAVGYQAGYTGTFSGFNTYVGYRAGYTANYGSAANTYNTFLGAYAGADVTTGAKNVIIGGYGGNSGGLDIRTLSNNIVLSDGDGNPRSFYVSDAWYWRTAGVERMRISDTGYLKVSDNASYLNAAGSYHEVNQTAANSSLVVRNSNASFTQDVIQARPVRNTTNGTFTAFLYYNETAATARFQVLDSGNVQNTNNSYGAISDIKLKENIVDATPKLEKLMDVKVRNYNLKSDQTHKQIGFIAQELEQVFPALVEEFADKDGDGKDLGTTTKAIKYSVFVPILVKAIQELKAEVDSLKSQFNK
jgi:hypothetical protein